MRLARFVHRQRIGPRAETPTATSRPPAPAGRGRPGPGPAQPALGLLGVGLGIGLCLGIGADAEAGLLTNADFADGFAGWTGATVACQVCDGSDDLIVELDPPPGAFDANFQISDNSAVLTTSFADDAIYEVRLWQEFVVDALTGRHFALLLNLGLGIDLSGPFDFVLAQLSDPAGVLPGIDLLGAGPVDITAYAGQRAELLFAVVDYDDVADQLRIGGLGIQQVPVPAPLLLLGLGIGLLAAQRRPQSHSNGA